MIKKLIKKIMMKHTTRKKFRKVNNKIQIIKKIRQKQTNRVKIIILIVMIMSNNKNQILFKII